MTTMRALLTRAIRKTRARPLGDDPAAEEMEAALEDAQAYFRTLTTRQLTDVYLVADYTTAEDERLTVDPAYTVTITLPDTIADACATDGERPPRNGAVVEVSGSTPARYVYISELGTWKQIDALALTSEQPFGPSLDEALADMLAARFCDSIFQSDPSAVLMQLAVQARENFGARFAQPIAAQTDRGLRQRIIPAVTDWLA